MQMIMTKRLEQKISDDKYLRNEEFQRSSKLYALSRVPRDKKMSILDVGCGTGVNLEYMAKLGNRIVGLDISEIAMRKCKNRGLSGIVCDIAEGLPFDNASFDMVFASEVLEHLNDTNFFLSEAYRVLRSGGTLLLSTPNSAFWVIRVLCLIGKTVTEISHPGHVRFFSKKSLLTYSRQGGFVQSKISGRHMYILIGDNLAKFVAPVLVKLGFKREYRFRTSTYFWHKSGYASCASGFWADTLILEARKPKKCS